MPLLEGVGDIFQEDEAENDMLVFGRIHAPAQGIGHAPELSLIAGCGALGVRSRLMIGLPLPRPSSCHAPYLYLFSWLVLREHVLERRVVAFDPDHHERAEKMTAIKTTSSPAVTPKTSAI